MNPATLFAIRKGLGLSQDGLAQLVGHKKSYYAEYEKGIKPIPDHVRAKVSDLWHQVNVSAAQHYNVYVEQFADLPDDEPKQAVILLYKQDDYHRWKVDDADHWPLTDLHTAVCNRLAFLLDLQGIQTRFVTFNWDSYQQWLGKREDTPAHRAQWATEV